jgi:hypothetical protein
VCLGDGGESCNLIFGPVFSQQERQVAASSQKENHMVKVIVEKAESFFCVAAGAFQLGTLLIVLGMVSRFHQ